MKPLPASPSPAAWRQALHPDWIVPDWPAPAWVRAVCTTRAGGVSGAAFASLNLGDHVADDPAAVRANRQRLRAATVPGPYLRQVHGGRVHRLGMATPGADPLQRAEADVTLPIEADAAVTDRAGLACTVLAADCLPVLLTDTGGTRVAAAHAGWRGLAGGDNRGRPAGILEAVCASFGLPAQAGRAKPAMKLMAWLGPCIGPEAFEVGPEVRAAFLNTASPAVREATIACFRPAHRAGHWRADLAGLARLRLAALGVGAIHGNDGSPAWCTVSQPSRFFSFRRDQGGQGASGRFATRIWIAGDDGRAIGTGATGPAVKG